MTDLSLSAVCMPSEDVVGREIEGDVVIIPLTSAIGDAGEELYTLNETGREIWRKLDGRRTLKEVAADLADEFDVDVPEVESDVLGFAKEMTRRGILIASSGS